MIRKWDIADEKIKKDCIDAVLTRIDEQGDDSPFGIIAAEEIIDIVASYLGPQVHNDALEAAKKAANARQADFELDLDILRVVS
jgi:uncharacterized protein (DUF2164 family)